MIPVVMGALAEFFGIENAFYIVGAVGMVAIVAISLDVRRNPAFNDHE